MLPITLNIALHFLIKHTVDTGGGRVGRAARTLQGACSELLQDLPVEELAFHAALRSRARDGADTPA